MKQKIAPIRDPTLFEMDKLGKAADMMGSLNVQREYSEPGLAAYTDQFAELHIRLFCPRNGSGPKAWIQSPVHIVLAASWLFTSQSSSNPRYRKRAE
jgi:hypothetical protein